MYFVTYATVICLGSEHRMKEIRRQSLSPQIPLYQSKRRAKSSQRFPHNATCESHRASHVGCSCLLPAFSRPSLQPMGSFGAAEEGRAWTRPGSLAPLWVQQFLQLIIYCSGTCFCWFLEENLQVRERFTWVVKEVHCPSCFSGGWGWGSPSLKCAAPMEWTPEAYGQMVVGITKGGESVSLRSNWYFGL